MHSFFGGIASGAFAVIEEARCLTDGLFLDIELGADEVTTDFEALGFVLLTGSSGGLALVGSCDGSLVACQDLSRDHTSHEDVLNADNLSSRGLVGIVIFVVAAPVIVMAVSVIALVATAPAVRAISLLVLLSL